MSISNEDTRVVFVGDGSDNSPYAISFPLRGTGDVEVIYVTDATGAEVVKTITTDYTIALAANFATATLTLVTTAPATGETMLIRRDQPITQQTTYELFDGFPASVVEADFDNNTMADLTSQEQIDRALSVAKGHPDANLPITPLNLIGNAEKIISVKDDETGFELIVNSDGSDAIQGPDPATSTDNAVVRWDGTGARTVQNSVVTIGDTGNIVTAGTIGAGTITGTNLNVVDTSPVVFISETAATANNKAWIVQPVSEQLQFLAVNDALSASESFMTVDRTLQVIDVVAFPNGVLHAGTSATVLTNADGTIKGAAFEAAIAGSGLNLTAGVLSVVGGGTIDESDIDTTGATNNDVIFNNAGTAAWGSIATIGVDLTTDVTGILPDANVADDLTIIGGTVNTTVIGGVTPAAITGTTITSTGLGTFATVDINGGNIDGTAIGASTPSTVIGTAVTGTSLNIVAAAPLLFMSETDQAADNKVWINQAVATQLQFLIVNDALTVSSPYFEIDRTGTTVDSVAIMEQMTIDTTTVTIGSNDLTLTAGDLLLSAGTAHIINGSSTGTADAGSDDLVVETNLSVGGMAVINTDANTSRISLGSPTIALGVFMQWSHDSGIYATGTQKVGAVHRLIADNSVLIGTLSGIATAELATFVRTVNTTNGPYQVAGTNVVGTRKTGWTAPTGTATRTGFATGDPPSNTVLAEHLKALIDDLTTHGLIGT